MSTTAETDERPAIEDFLCFAIYSAGHAMNRVYKRLLDDMGLTYPQYLTMVALWDRDGQSVGALGRRLQLESNTLTPLVKRLEGMGLVIRRRDETDERQVRVSLTPAGRELRAQAHHVPRCVLEATGLDMADAADLRDRLLALRDRLEATAGR